MTRCGTPWPTCGGPGSWPASAEWRPRSPATCWPGAVSSAAQASTSLTRRQRRAVVLAGFGGFIGRGGSAIDRYAMLAAGMDKRDADVRLTGLDALEHTPLAVGCCAAAIYLLAAGLDRPAAARLRLALGGRPVAGRGPGHPRGHPLPGPVSECGRLRRYLGIGLNSVALLGRLSKNPKSGSYAFAGMSLYWAGEMFALWACAAAFGTRTSVPVLIIADAVGFVLTRRAAPLGGAGFIDACLALCLWDCNVPLQVAIAGVFTYRFFSLFAIMPFSFTALPALRSDPLAGPALPQPRASGHPARFRPPSWLTDIALARLRPWPRLSMVSFGSSGASKR